MKKLVFLLACFCVSASVVSLAQTTSLFPSPKAQFLDNLGLIVPGGKICTFQAGTTTPLASYADGSNSPATNSNPVVLDSAGRANIWLGPQKYKIVFYDGTGDSSCPNSGGQIWSVDNVSGTNLALQAAAAFAASAAPTCNAGQYYVWFDSSALRQKFCNNGTIDTVVGENTTDTLAHKTLTSPVIVTPSWSGDLGYGTWQGINSIRFADQFPGADIGAKVNAAFLDCANACTVIIPAGSYSYSTTINFPVVHDGTAKLIGTGGVTLTYTGAGYAVDALGQAASVNAANVDIEGLQIIGSSSGLAGIRLALFNRGVLINNDIQGFTNGPGIVNQGANAVTYVVDNVRANKYGLHDIGSGTESASGNTWIGGHIQSNTSYGYWCDSSVTTAGLNAGNSFHGATVEGNGVNYFVEGGRAIAIFGGYMEGATSKNITLGGTTADAAHTAYATVISGTFMASPNLGDSIFLQQAIGTKIDGNFEIGTPTNFINQAAASQQTDVGRNTAALATNYWAGTDDTQTAIVYPNNKQYIPDVFAGNSLAAKLAKTATVRGTAELNAGDNVPDALNANLSHGVNVTDAGNLGMSFGVTSTGTTHGWIQARNTVGANNTAYPLWLNELGGEVKVGPGGLKIGASGSNIPDSRNLAQFTATLTTTAATSDNVAISGVTASSKCSLTPTNASAATNIATAYISAKTTNQITVTHTATGSMTYDILCSAQ